MRGFTIVEILVVLMIIGISLMVGAITLSSRAAANALQRAAQELEADLIRARDLALKSKCRVRVVPCRDAVCTGTDPTSGGFGFVLQQLCQSTQPTGNCAGNLCNATDGYLNWDFVTKPRVFADNIEDFGPSADPLAFVDWREDISTAGLIFPSSVSDGVTISGNSVMVELSNGTLPEVTDSAGHAGFFELGLRNATTTGDLRWVIGVSGGGNVVLRKCGVGSCF